MKKTSFILSALLVASVAFSGAAAEIKLPERKSMFTPDATLKYGSHERQTILFYRTLKADPAPLVLFIHGGGWQRGDGVKDTLEGRTDRFIWDMVNRGISVAVVNYRLGKLPDPVDDAIRALQYLRYHAKELHIDKERVAASGFSAGATTALYIALHDDMAKPNSPDPIARESTRIRGAVAAGVQSSIDPEVLRSWGLGEATKHYMIFSCAGFKNVREMDAGYPGKKDLYYEYSPINHLDRDDPEFRVYANDLQKQGNWIHHGIFGAKLKEKADKVGAKCEAFGMSENLKDRRDSDFIERVLKKDYKK